MEDSVDRISNLPPDLIGKILSYLPSTKQAVATSVLSSTWKWFWTFITRLNFAHWDHRVDSINSFLSFVDRVILYRKPTALDYFGFNCYHGIDISHFREWVSAALLVDVKVLDLHLGLGCALPFDLFSSKNLVKLILHVHGFYFPVPPTVCLPSLEVLSLRGERFLDDDSFERLVTGCPVLEQLSVVIVYGGRTSVALPQELFSSRKLAKLELVAAGFIMTVPALVSLPSLRAIKLSGVRFMDDDSVKRFISGCTSLQELNLKIQNIPVLHIDSPTLSSLVVSEGIFFGERDDVVGRKVVLQTPSLQYLEINGMSADSFEVGDLNQLVELKMRDMRFGRRYQGMYNLVSVRRYQGVNNLVMGVSNVRRLYICGSAMEVIVESGCELPKFHNLATLKLGVSNAVGWTLLPDLLEKSPFLEMLVFDEGLTKATSSKNATWHAPQKVPYCLIHHLKVIQVNHFEGDIEGEAVIQYFIENKGGLKDLTIQYSSGSGKLWDIN